MRLIVSIVLIMTVSFGFAQKEGAITKKLIKEIRQEYSKQDYQALRNAVTNGDFATLSKNTANKPYVDTYFAYRVNTKGITNQKSSGRCWLFTGYNVLRPKVIEKLNLNDFEFSQNYGFFWDQFEKSNLFLEGIINTADKPMDDKKVEWLFKNVISDGGQWTGVNDIITKYGVVPKEIMPETHSSENTRWMGKMLRSKLKEQALVIRRMKADGKSEDEIRSYKEDVLADIYKILAINLGEPPIEFEWRYKDADGTISELKRYTPQSFYKEFVGIDLDDYVMFMNDPSRPYNRVYEIDNDRHTYEGHNWKFINLDVNQIKKFALASIKNNEAMYFSCDVGKQLDRDAGTLDVNNFDYWKLLDLDFQMNKKDRIRTFESGSTHGMTLVAVDVDESGDITKWLLENSWGMKGFKGHLIMTDKWFDEYMFRLVINKKYIDKDILRILDEKPVRLPAWDPMFQEDE